MRTEKQLKNLKKGAPKFDSEAGSEAGKKGGIKSGEVRRNLSEIREWLEQDLFAKLGNEKGKKEETFKAVFNKLKSEAMKGNMKAVELYLNYAGLKPIEKVENTINREPIKIEFID